MSTRSRPPTDPQRTAIYDPERAPRAGQGAGAEIATPTDLAAPLPPPPLVSPLASSPAQPLPPILPQAPPVSAYDSQPIRVISLKAPGEASEDRGPVKQHRPRLRRLSEVAPRARVATPPGGLGYLAPPRDPREARTRRLRDYVRWGAVVVIVAGAVTLAVWFIAGG